MASVIVKQLALGVACLAVSDLSRAVKRISDFVYEETREVLKIFFENIGPNVLMSRTVLAVWIGGS